MQFTHYIAGEFQAATKSLPVIEPATGAVYASVADATSQEVAAAVRAAKLAAPSFAALAGNVRGEWLRKLAAAIESRSEEFAGAESRDTGKPIAAARAIDIPRAIANFRFFASAAETYATETHASPEMLHYSLRQPLGAVACISPWNLPLYLLSWKLAPALAFGNTVVAKPSELSPYTAHLLAEVAHQIQLPNGVLNIVHGSGATAGSQLVSDSAIKAVSFTGSTQTGRAIASATAVQFKKLSLEMGGKNATIIFADADFDLAVREAVRAAFSNQGQICLCGSKILVEQALMPRFREAFLAHAAGLLPSDPSSDQCQFGALISSEHLRKVEAAVAVAHEEGGRLLLGGLRTRLEGRCAAGYFYPPTVFDQLPIDCATNQHEIFGPVVTLIPFQDEAQALLYANQSDYGLACSVFTADLSRAQRFAAGLQVGMVWINAWMQRDLRVPFGGWKQSGLGREGGVDAFRFFTEAKSVGIANR